MAIVETENKTDKVVSRDLELLKIQSLDGYLQTKVNAGYTFVYGVIIAFLFTILTLYYNKVFNIFENTGFNLLFFLAVLFGFGFIIKQNGLDPIRKLHDDYLATIDTLIVRVEKGETLESLSELKEIVKGKQKKKHWWQ